MRKAKSWTKKDQIKEEPSGKGIGGAMGKGYDEESENRKCEGEYFNKMSNIRNFEVMKS